MSFDPSTAFTPSPVTVAVPTAPGTAAPVTVAVPVPLTRDRRHFDENGAVELDEHGEPTLSEPHFPTPT